MKNTSVKTGIVILGAGYSCRTGIDKIFYPLSGKPLLAWSVDICQKCNLIDQIAIVLNDKNINKGKKLALDRDWSKVIKICLGGSQRQDSVFQGIKHLKDCEWIIIHDGARPFLTDDLIQNGLISAQETGSAAAAVPVTDTIKLSNYNNIVQTTLPRQYLWSVQTPQIFHFDIIAAAYKKITENVTDDASIVEKCGYKVKLFLGSYNNIKITTHKDLLLAKIIAKEKKNRCELE